MVVYEVRCIFVKYYKFSDLHIHIVVSFDFKIFNLKIKGSWIFGNGCLPKVKKHKSLFAANAERDFLL